MDDQKIIELFFERDEKAVEETKIKYGQLCFSLAKKILVDSCDSEECVNDAYLAMWNAIPPARPGNFKAFLCKATRNLALKKLTYNTRQKRASGTTVPFSELEEVLSAERTAPEPDSTELSSLISDFLRSEKESSRNVFIRRYWYFDSIHEISERYSFSESKVKSMLHQSRIRLKKFLTERGIQL